MGSACHAWIATLRSWKGSAGEYVALAVGDDAREDHEPDGEQQAGEYPGHEQTSYGNGGAGHQRIDDHGVRRRNDRAEVRGRNDDGTGVPVIVVLSHRRDERGAEGGRGCDGCPGDGGENHARDDRDMSEAAVQTPDQGVGEVNETLEDAGADHELARQHEKRDGHQRKAVYGIHHPLRQNRQPEVGVHQAADRGEPEREGERHADQREQKEDADDDDGHVCDSTCHVELPPQPSSVRCRMLCPAAIRTAM